MSKFFTLTVAFFSLVAVSHAQEVNPAPAVETVPPSTIQSEKPASPTATQADTLAYTPVTVQKVGARKTKRSSAALYLA